MRVERASTPPAATIEIEAIREPVERWEAARDTAKAADRELAELERGRGRLQAEQQDAAELAATIRNGKPAPQPHHVAEFDARLATAKREAAARVIVEQSAWSEVEASFREHGDKLTERAAKSFETARRAYLRALKTLQEAHTGLQQTKAMCVFTTASDAAYRPGGGFLSVAEVPLPPPDPDSGGTRVDAVLAALEVVGSDRPLHPPGVNPAAVRPDGGQTPPQRHRPLGEQGRSAPFAPSAGPGAVRVPG